MVIIRQVTGCRAENEVKHAAFLPAKHSTERAQEMTFYTLESK